MCTLGRTSSCQQRVRSAGLALHPPHTTGTRHYLAWGLGTGAVTGRLCCHTSVSECWIYMYFEHVVHWYDYFIFIDLCDLNVFRFKECMKILRFLGLKQLIGTWILTLSRNKCCFGCLQIFLT